MKPQKPNKTRMTQREPNESDKKRIAEVLKRINKVINKTK